MKIRPECIPCILRVRSEEIIKGKLSENEKIASLVELLKLASELSITNPYTVELAWLLFNQVRKRVRTEDPYKRYKELSNDIIKEVLRVKSAFLSEMGIEEKFMVLVLASVNANSIDPGAPPFEINLRDISGKLFSGVFAVDERRKIFERLSEASKVVYILDNAGEAVVDLEIVKLLEKLGIDVTVVARSLPYQNDITVTEAKRLGFRKVIGTGSGFPGIWPEYVSKKVIEIIQEADQVVAKGMANYEAFYAKPPGRDVIHILKAKCKPVAETLGVEVNANVAKIIKW